MSTRIFTYEPNIPIQEEIGWNVLSTPSESWKEKRRLKSNKPRRKYTLNFMSRTQAVMQDITNFYNNVSGDFDTFYWKNPMETPVTLEMLGSGDGVKTVYNAANYPLASGSYTVFVNGVAKTEVTHYTISGTTGAITFTGASIPPLNQAVEMTYDFYRIVRFAEPITRELMGYKLVNGACKFIEVI